MTAPRLTVLIVDDEPEILASLRRQLRNESFNLELTKSPFHALERIEAGAIDLVIADIDMPGMSGIELVARVRASRPDVIRILLTGDASLSSAVEAINEGEVYRYLQKPWDRKELVQVIHHALARQSELRVLAHADALTDRREQLLDELEKAHPGIRDVRLEDGAYVVDRDRLDALAAASNAAAIREFLVLTTAPVAQSGADSKGRPPR